MNACMLSGPLDGAQTDSPMTNLACNNSSPARGEVPDHRKCCLPVCTKQERNSLHQFMYTTTVACLHTGVQSATMCD
eukprot:scaffold241003_cov23-Tisochrysis_lutea.AAC.1